MDNNPVLRHPAEAQFMKYILEHDSQAVQDFLNKLSSTDVQRCKVLQETIHDLNDPFIWYHLLHYLALHRWDNQAFSNLRIGSVAQERIDQAIVEVLTQDENNDENPIKDSVLHEALAHPEDQLQYAAAYLLGLRYDPRAISILAEIIEKGSNKWKLRSVKALATLKVKDCAEPLMKALVLDRGKLHREARRALQKMGQLAESVWLKALNHSDSHIRWDAACGLGQIGDARAAPTLAEGLFDESYAVRWAAANVLAQLEERGVPATLSVLTVRTINQSSRQAAYHALQGITSPRIHERLLPLLEALCSSTSSVTVPSVAQRLLMEWERNE